MTEIFNLSLKDFLLIIKKSWISILIIGIIGFICAFIALQFIPNTYISTAQVQLTQIRGSNYEWTNLEDPNLLIARMKSPTSFGDKSLTACQYSSGFELVKKVQFGLLKASPPTLEIIVKNRTPELALACTEAIVLDLKNYETDLISLKIVQYKELLSYYFAKMNNLKKEFSKLPTSQSTIASVDEIAARDQIAWITSKVMSLDSVIRFADEGAGKLLSPIYVSPTPVSPKRFIIEIAGLLMGLLVGLFISVFRVAYLPRIKALR
jgi:capsular polysaccharide biosynthesis protein